MARKRTWYQKVLDWLFAHVFPPVFVWVLRLLAATLRWEIRGRNNLSPYWDEGHPIIIAFWHGRLLLAPPAWQRCGRGRGYVVVGNNRNGELIARIIKPFGIEAVRGSSHEAGRQAREQMAAIFRRGGANTLSVTPDGPHGPRYVSKMGLAHMSRSLNCPVVWLTISARPAWRVPVWDRFVFPAPFAKVIVHWSAPIHPSDYASQSLEQWRNLLDDFGRSYALTVDEELGVTLVEDRPLLEAAAARLRARGITIISARRETSRAVG